MPGILYATKEWTAREKITMKELMKIRDDFKNKNKNESIASSIIMTCATAPLGGFGLAVGIGYTIICSGGSSAAETCQDILDYMALNKMDDYTVDIGYEATYNIATNEVTKIRVAWVSWMPF